MDDTSLEELRELSEWAPERGVISVYLDIDPADRGGGWRIELEQGLGRIADEAEGGADREAVRATADRILARFPQDAPHRTGRAQVGFAEVAKEGRDVWRGFQTGLGDSLVTRDSTPRLAPLVRILERGAPVGVLLLSSERCEALEWSYGLLEELGQWELEVTDYDWRERRAPRRDPQRGTGASAAGRDQHEQRLRDSRQRFLKELGGKLAHRFGERDWRCILAFGEGDLADHLAAGMGAQASKLRVVHADLIRAETAEIERQVDAEVTKLNAERERQMLERLEEAIGTDSGAAVGPQEVMDALEQGRASHLVFDATREFESRNGRPGTELMVGMGLQTGAEIIPVSGEEEIDRLAAREGAAAILRY